MGSPFLQVQGACEETAHPRDRGLEEKPDCGFGLTICTCIRISLILIYVLFKSKNINSWKLLDIVWIYVLSTVDGPKWPYWIYILHILLIGTGLYRFCIWVELPVQRRLCPIF